MNFNSDFDDLDDLVNELDNIKFSYDLDELFSENFMKKYTKYSSIEDFLSNCGYEDYESIPDEELDKYVINNTSFTSWQDMIAKATEEIID